MFYANLYRVTSSIYCNYKCQNKDYITRFSGHNNPFYGKKHTDKTKELLRASSAKQRSKAVVLPTKPESKIHDELIKLEIIFETEYLINDKFCADIFIPHYNLIIYVDGCYWHACPIHCSYAKKPQHDNARVPYLTKCGYNVEIFWEHDINSNSKGLIENLCLKYNIQTPLTFPIINI